MLEEDDGNKDRREGLHSCLVRDLRYWGYCDIGLEMGLSMIQWPVCCLWPPHNCQSMRSTFPAHSRRAKKNIGCL